MGEPGGAVAGTVWASRTGRQWRLKPVQPAVVEAIRASLRVSMLAARVLAARGYDPSTARVFLDPGMHQLYDPNLLRGLPEAVARIRRALAEGQPIRLVTDYDVDGTTSCLILHAALDRCMSASGSASVISYHIPDRFKEGYGLSALAVERAVADGVGLLITADIGVRDHASIRRARELGLDVLVCDHHLPPGESVPPDAFAVVCPPQQGCPYPNKSLAACGVSLKLASALLADDPRGPALLKSMMKLAAIGTVADVVDLANPENRSIVTMGLEQLNIGGHSAGLNALLDVADLRPGGISVTDIGFRVAPRINAAGRLEDANAVVRLIRERSPAIAAQMAQRIDKLNRDRRNIQDSLVKQVLDGLPDPLPEFVVASGPEVDGWHRGVVGIVAAKVRDQVNRPVAVLAELGPNAGDVITGSVRSTPQVHAVHALDAVQAMLVRYGGHAAAAGFTLRRERLDEFRAGLCAYVRDHCDAADNFPDEADALLPGTALHMRLLEELEVFEPCGKGNPPPAMIVTGEITHVRVMKERHLKFKVGGVEAVWWGAVERQVPLEGAQAVFGTLERNTWQGSSSLQINVTDVA